MKISEITSSARELAGLFLNTASKTVFVVGSLAPVTLIGGPLAALGMLVGGGLGLLGIYAAGMASRSTTLWEKSSGLVFGAGIFIAGAALGGAMGGVAVAATIVSGVAGIAVSGAIAVGLWKLGDILLSTGKSRHVTVEQPSGSNGGNLVERYSLPAKIVRLAGVFGIAAAIAVPAYLYKDDVKNLPVIKQLYNKS
jgi:hypothetical protein